MYKKIAAHLLIDLLAISLFSLVLYGAVTILPWILACLLIFVLSLIALHFTFAMGFEDDGEDEDSYVCVPAFFFLISIILTGALSKFFGTGPWNDVIVFFFLNAIVTIFFRLWVEFNSAQDRKDSLN